MAKNKLIFVCQECGYEASKWQGQCPACNEWNTFSEEVVAKKAAQPTSTTEIGMPERKPEKLKDIRIDEDYRIHTKISELDRVLGGGIVQGSLILVGGDPGIGKSTLLLQMCHYLCLQKKNVLYVSGEESLKQIKLRAERLHVDGTSLDLYSETSISTIETTCLNNKPDILIIDSIQTLFCEDLPSSPGSVSQVREATARLMKISKNLNIATFIVGHVTKEGAIAGPRVLEHMVDTVLYFEGDRSASYRILRAVKNRFGSTNEIGVFEMCQEGLKEVTNPSEYMLNGRPVEESGSIVACCMEGTRPLLVEVQALLSPTSFGMPRRTANGTDYNRVNLLLAVLEKKVGMQVANYDGYINIAGGIKVTEPALDLGIMLAVASSFRNIPIDEKTVIMGEVGLTGEVRGISQCELRLQEAAKLGFTKCIIPKVNATHVKAIKGLKIVGVSTVKEAIWDVFSKNS